MKKIFTTLATLSLLTLASCGDSGGSTPTKQALTKRKIDPAYSQKKEAVADVSAKEGEDPKSTKKQN